MELEQYRTAELAHWDAVIARVHARLSAVEALLPDAEERMAAQEYTDGPFAEMVQAASWEWHQLEQEADTLTAVLDTAERLRGQVGVVNPV